MKNIRFKITTIIGIFILLSLVGCSSESMYMKGLLEGKEKGFLEGKEEGISIGKDIGLEEGIKNGINRGYNMGYSDGVAGKPKRLNLNYFSSAKLFLAYSVTIIVLVVTFLSVLLLVFISGSDAQKLAKIIGILISAYLWFRFIYPELTGILKYESWQTYGLYIEISIFISSMFIAWIITGFIERSIEIGNLLLSMVLTPTLLTGTYFIIGWKEIGAIMGEELFTFRIHGAIFVGVGIYLVSRLITEE